MEGKTNETPTNDDNEKGEEEEQKINIFFTLLRNTQDAYNQMLIGLQDPNEKEIKSTWTPSFKQEDFVEDSHLRNNI